MRDQILIEPSIRYFSANSFGLLSRAVYYRLSELRFELAKNPADFLLRQAPDLLWRSRSTLAKFIGTHPERILFTSNASSALSLITSSLNSLELLDSSSCMIGYCVGIDIFSLLPLCYVYIYHDVRNQYKSIQILDQSFRHHKHYLLSLLSAIQHQQKDDL